MADDLEASQDWIWTTLASIGRPDSDNLFQFFGVLMKDRLCTI